MSAWRRTAKGAVTGGVLMACSLLGCASKKAIVTMPLSGSGQVGDELSTRELEPCTPGQGQCIEQINSCPRGIAKLEIVRRGSKLFVTPSCFVPAGADCVQAGDSLGGPGTTSEPTADSHIDPSKDGADINAHEDPGDL